MKYLSSYSTNSEIYLIWIISDHYMYHISLSQFYFKFLPQFIQGGLNHLFRRINFSILRHGMWFLKTCISVLLPEATLVLGFGIVSTVRNLIVNISIITLCIFFVRIHGDINIIVSLFYFWLLLNSLWKVL